VVVRLGGGGTSATSAPPGSALPVTLDYVDTATGAVWLSVPAPPACTLPAGDVSPGSTAWGWDATGLPSNSEDGGLVVLPCYDAPVGAPAATLLAAGTRKTLALLGPAGRVAARSFAGFSGARGSASGLRQAATVDGSGFWVAGVAEAAYGVRYLAGSAAAGATPARVLGGGAPASADGSYQPGTRDVRGVSAAFGALTVTSAFVTEPNAGGGSPWGGLARATAAAGGTLLPTGPASGAALRPGFNGRSNWWAFVFQGRGAVWLVRDDAAYAPAASVATALTRSRLASTVVSYAWTDAGGGAWRDATGYRGRVADAVYSLAGRPEGARRVWTLYTASRTALYRLVPSAGTLTTLASAPPGQLFRGVVLPPVAVPPAAGASASPSRAAGGSPSRSRSGKPKA
jgi:hypothetical protein